MFRTLCLAAAVVLTQSAAAQEPAGPGIPPAGVVPAHEVASRIWAALDMQALMPILRDEALAEAEAMQENLPESGADRGWLEAVAQIHEPERLAELFRAGIADRLSLYPDQRLDGALAFYEAEFGQRLVGLETSARRAMLDPDAEALAREAFSTAASHQEARVEQIGRLIEVADLIGPNVAGGLNAAVAFSRGFAEGGGFDMPLSEEQMLADAWSQEPEIHSETLGWMEAYLMLAYSPLSDAELERYIGFAASPEGHGLAALLFSGFDRLFQQTSRDLGLAAAGLMRGRDL
ncbi:DUF2059 domain-containing protein [Paracoccus marinaquae]|uniref:DUF2059 domain-containing protein n=1 Tax=Paracoccus marinaquae TaxID=2841926 RepID=A0ABS6AGZ2_9RHOB|nr:DUF2059 domain-containing protein [Paracoccus marinaquae]MBU3029778.1 DUF2059 domain-containing protein [Paracoccus marinaquae]